MKTKIRLDLKMLKVTGLLVPVILVSGCSITPVKPWEKATLAQDIVKFGGPNPMIKKFEEHIFTSKEGSKGGGGVSGGGCGCN